MEDQQINSSDRWTLEIVPDHAEKASVFQGLVKEIFVTMIPGTGQDRILEALATLKTNGFEAVPHIAVRNFISEQEMADFCEGMRRQGIRKALILAGGLGQPAGPFSRSMDLLRFAPFKESGVEVVAMAGHPEGNPADAQPMVSLREKADYLQSAGLSGEIVTQWSFSPDKVSQYLQVIKEEPFAMPVRVGVAGPASLKTLLKYARICGVAASTEVLKKQGFSLGRLLFSNDPKGFVRKVKGSPYFHLYPFGGLEKCAEWLNKQAEVAC